MKRAITSILAISAIVVISIMIKNAINLKDAKELFEKTKIYEQSNVYWDTKEIYYNEFGEEEIKSEVKRYRLNNLLKVIPVKSEEENSFSYYVEDNEKVYIVSHENRTVIITNKTNQGTNFSDIYNNELKPFYEKNKENIKYKKTEKVNGKDCYVLEYKNNGENEYKIWLEKESGVVVRIQTKDISNDEISIKEYEYSIDTVTENDFVVPELDEYNVRNVRN